MLTVTTGLDRLDDALAQFVRGMDRPQAFLKRWGQSTAKTARESARAKGGRRFWSDIARSVQMQSVSDDAVSVHTKHVAAAQKQFGGVIKPKNRKALTIPIADEARGKRASDFERGGRELFVLPSDKADTTGVLGYTDGNDMFHALFVLRTKVTQDAEPWWPTDDQVLQLGVTEAARFIQEALD